MTRKLTICFTSDTHGYLYPTNYVDPEEKDMGLMKAAGRFPHDGNTLILDGGDTIQGSPMTNYYFRLDQESRKKVLKDERAGTHPFAAMMNLAGYQYVTLGNHDFNMGVAGLKDFLGSLKAQCLCCNIRDKEGKLPIRPWIIHTMENGLRVGLVGACTDFVAKWEKPETAAELEILEPVEACRKAYEEIADQCDLTVLMYHGGYELDLEDGHALTESRENQAGRICKELHFDIVLTGHQHMSVPCRFFGNSWTAQPAYRGLDHCRLEIEVEEDGSLSVEGSNVKTEGNAVPEAAALLQPLQDMTEAWLDTPVGQLDTELDVGDHIEMGLHGSYLANFINTVTTELTGAQISATALANEAKGLPKTVTIRHVVAAYIYANTSVVLDLTGADLKKYMERSAAYFTLQPDGEVRVSDDFLLPKVQHYNYDFFSGVDYEIDLRKAVGERIASMKIREREIEPDEHVSVCISSYRYNGTGGYDMLPGQKVLKDVQVDTADAITDYILRHPDIRVDKRQWYTVKGIESV